MLYKARADLFFFLIKLWSHSLIIVFSLEEFYIFFFYSLKNPVMILADKNYYKLVLLLLLFLF